MDNTSQDTDNNQQSPDNSQSSEATKGDKQSMQDRGIGLVITFRGNEEVKLKTEFMRLAGIRNQTHVVKELIKAYVKLKQAEAPEQRKRKTVYNLTMEQIAEIDAQDEARASETRQKELENN